MRALTIKEAAAKLAVHPDTLRRWADRGHLSLLRTPTGYWRVDADELDRLRQQMTEAAQAR